MDGSAQVPLSGDGSSPDVVVISSHPSASVYRCTQQERDEVVRGRTVRR